MRASLGTELSGRVAAGLFGLDASPAAALEAATVVAHARVAAMHEDGSRAYRAALKDARARGAGHDEAKEEAARAAQRAREATEVERPRPVRPSGSAFGPGSEGALEAAREAQRLLASCADSRA